MHIVNPSNPHPTLATTRVGRACHPLNIQSIYRQMHQPSNAERERACRTKIDRTVTVCKAQATGSPTKEKPRQAQQLAQETDVVVIGSGIGGLCCAALLAKYGLKVLDDQHRALDQNLNAHHPLHSRLCTLATSALTPQIVPLGACTFATAMLQACVPRHILCS